MKIDRELIYKGLQSSEFGLEKESLRIQPDGTLADTPHPFALDSPIQRDFCESQTEIITGVWNSVEEVCQDLERLHEAAVLTLAGRREGKELLWPFSVPPYIEDESQIRIAQYKGKQGNLKKYREYLAGKYGKRKMLFCGIHVNFSLQESLLQEIFDVLGPEYSLKDMTDLKNRLYLDLAGKTVKYGWFLVYLLSASPILSGTGEDGTDYASPRCGEKGYWNDFVPILQYENLETYVQSVEKYMQEGWLQSAGELYYPVRVKPRGTYSLEALSQKGINHIELRILDLNPLSEYGVLEQDLLFLQLFFLFLMQKEGGVSGEVEQREAVKNIKEASKLFPEQMDFRQNGKMDSIERAAGELLAEMEAFYAHCESADRVLKILSYQKKKLTAQKERYAVRLASHYGSDDMEDKLALAKKYTEDIIKKHRCKEAAKTGGRLCVKYLESMQNAQY